MSSREPNSDRGHGAPQIAVDIPGAAPYVSSQQTPGSSSPEAPFIASISLGLGTSPGHGHGYLMRSRRKAPHRQTSREFSLLSHDELDEGDTNALLDSADPSPDNNNNNHVSPTLHVINNLQRTGSLLSSQHNLHRPYNTLPHEDSRTFTVPQDELTAPLLPTPSYTAGLAASAEQPRNTPITQAIVFGGINAVAGIPALVAYAAIVFRHPAYAPFLDLLCKFFFISSALHQTVFCLLSRLPFAMGQVQDVGIIFLSAMGTSIADLVVNGAHKDAETALGTALLAMTGSTFLVGLGTLFVAKKSLAQFVQYIPLPVMGGYLGFVGYFCIASGLGLGTSVEINTLTSWSNLFSSTLPLIKLIPTVASCAVMVITLERARHPLALPSVLVALVLCFHAVLLCAGISLEHAQESGWVLPPADGPVKFWQLWNLYHFETWTMSGIYFPAIWRQLAKTLGLLLVVVFGSCMDIAAIQQDVSYKIDFNQELTTVAVSNMATGLTGIGFTGSYIFSQTIFTMRAGVFSRINGWVIAGAEFAAFIYPYSIVQYLPNYFLGALLVWFGVEISRDWLYLSFYKLTLVEYGLLWLTFGSVMQWGLEGGIAAGIVSATLYFAYAYARSQVQSFGAGQAQSSVVRTVEHQAALRLLWDSHATTAQLQGFVFFGSAQSIGTKLSEAAARVSEAGKVRGAGEAAIQQSMRSMGEGYAGGKHSAALAALEAAPKFLVIDFSKVTGMDCSGARTIAGVVRDMGQLGVTPIVTGARKKSVLELLSAHDVALKPMRWPPNIPRISTDSGTGNGNLGNGGAEKQAADDVSEVLMFATLEEGLRFCEDALLEIAVQFSLCKPPSAGVSLEELLASHLNKLPLTSINNAAAMAATLRRYMVQETIRRGDILWNTDDPADELLLIERGVIRVDQFVAHRSMHENDDDTDDDGGSEHGATSTAQYRTDRRSNDGFLSYHDERDINHATHGAPVMPPPMNNTSPFFEGTLDSYKEWEMYLQEAAMEQRRMNRRKRVRVRSFELGPGCVAGSTSFYLARPQGTRAVCASVACRILRLNRAAMQRMAVEAPVALNVLQMAIMRANSADLSMAADAAAGF